MNKKELSILIKATREDVGNIAEVVSNPHHIGDGDKSYINDLKESIETLENYITKYHELD